MTNQIVSLTPMYNNSLDTVILNGGSAVTTSGMSLLYVVFSAFDYIIAFYIDLPCGTVRFLYLSLEMPYCNYYIVYTTSTCSALFFMDQFLRRSGFILEKGVKTASLTLSEICCYWTNSLSV